MTMTKTHQLKIIILNKVEESYRENITCGEASLSYYCVSALKCLLNHTQKQADVCNWNDRLGLYGFLNYKTDDCGRMKNINLLIEWSADKSVFHDAM